MNEIIVNSGENGLPRVTIGPTCPEIDAFVKPWKDGHPSIMTDCIIDKSQRKIFVGTMINVVIDLNPETNGIFSRTSP